MIARENRRAALAAVYLVLYGLGAGAAAGETAAAVEGGLRFRSIGPAVMGGRIDAVAVDEERPWSMYIGTASGGVWKTDNMGTTWSPIFDGEETSSVGDVAVSPSDPDIVWVGTGEPNNRQSSSFGTGVYRSENGGRTFTRVGLERSGHIGAVAVHPRDPNRVYVAALGGLWAAGGERGVYRTLDGGKTWERALFVDENTGAVTLAMDPVNPDVLYAAAYQRRRVPWGFDGGGPGSGLYKSTDGGASWRKIEKGLPQGVLGRIGIDVHRADPRVVYAIVEHEDEGGVYRSLDRGESFEKISSHNPRPMYYSKIFVDPRDRDRVYVLGSEFHVSDDGGRTFVENEQMTPTYDVGVHGDHHSLWIDPSRPEHLVLGGDGGLYFSWDRGRTWDKVNNIPLAQFYAIAVDMEDPYHVYGGAQDTHSWVGPSRTRNHIGILNSDWVQIHFGDGMYQQADPSDPSIAYTESQGGNLVRLDRRTGDRKSIQPHPPDDGTSYRFHWTSPFVLSRFDPQVLYLGGNRLFVSRDRGESWTASPDLTWNEDRTELPIMGSIPGENTLSRHDGVQDWGTITTIAESPLDALVLYVGTDDGRLQITRDGGKSFKSLEGQLGLDAKRATVSRVVASHASPGRAYVSVDRHQLGDFAPYIRVTEDFGGSFRALGAGLPSTGWVNVIAEHPRNGDLLFVGTETGLFVSFDRGESFRRMNGGLPTVPVDDVVIHPRDNDLVVGTHGRSIYILDDVTPLEKHDPDATGIELFDARRATLFLPWKHESYGGQRQFVGENPPFGAILTYHIPRTPEGDVRLSVKDADGTLVRALEGKSGVGFQRLSWDLRAPPPEGLARARGPLVPPGRYTVELSAGSERSESFVDVALDPRSSVSGSEFRERFEFLKEVNDLRARLEGVVARGDSLRKQIEAAVAALSTEQHEDLRKALGELSDKIESARRPIGGGRPSFQNPSLAAQSASLFEELDGEGVQQGTLHGPTRTQRERLRQLTRKSGEAIGVFDDAASAATEEANRRLREVGPLQVRP
jgi:photosystem II stability/assembly factor-like uncharacterized protein